MLNSCRKRIVKDIEGLYRIWKKIEDRIQDILYQLLSTADAFPAEAAPLQPARRAGLATMTRKRGLWITAFTS